MKIFHQLFSTFCAQVKNISINVSNWKIRNDNTNNVVDVRRECYNIKKPLKMYSIHCIQVFLPQHSCTWHFILHCNNCTASIAQQQLHCKNCTAKIALKNCTTKKAQQKLHCNYCTATIVLQQCNRCCTLYLQ